MGENVGNVWELEKQQTSVWWQVFVFSKQIYMFKNVEHILVPSYWYVMLLDLVLQPAVYRLIILQ